MHLPPVFHDENESCPAVAFSQTLVANDHNNTPSFWEGVKRVSSLVTIVPLSHFFHCPRVRPQSRWLVDESSLLSSVFVVFYTLFLTPPKVREVACNDPWPLWHPCVCTVCFYPVDTRFWRLLTRPLTVHPLEKDALTFYDDVFVWAY